MLKPGLYLPVRLILSAHVTNAFVIFYKMLENRHASVAHKSAKPSATGRGPWEKEVKAQTLTARSNANSSLGSSGGPQPFQSSWDVGEEEVGKSLLLADWEQKGCRGASAVHRGTWEGINPIFLAARAATNRSSLLCKNLQWCSCFIWKHHVDVQTP
jgi:hypothetical protein